MQAADYRAILALSCQTNPPHQADQNRQQIAGLGAHRHWAAGSSAPIMITKLTCPPPAGLTPRPALIWRLDQNRDRRLTLVSAPAGYGKTALLSAWADRSASPVAWVSLDAGESRPARFWDYVRAALEIAQPSSGSFERVPHAALAGSVAQIQASLINCLAQLPPMTLILDNYQVVDDEELHQSLVSFIDHLPPTLHLIIASRARPPFPLPRWRIANWLSELGVAELQFGLDEASALVEQSLGHPLPPDAIAELNEHAEGWVAGLCLAAQRAREGLEPGERMLSLGAGQRDIQDYLEDEVLGQLPEELRVFLLRTAVADRICAPLCAELCLPTQPGEPAIGVHAPDIAGAHTLLTLAERAGLFLVPLDAERRWYRYHTLFAEALRYRLDQADPALAEALRARAAAWLAKHPDEHHAQPADRAQLAAANELALSQRELDVLRLLIDGCSNQEIARELIIGVNTVKMHVKHLYDKLDAHSRVQAAAQARRFGLIP